MKDEAKLVIAFKEGDEQALIDLLKEAEPMFLHFVKIICSVCKRRGWYLSEDDIEDALSSAKLEYIGFIQRYDVYSGIKLKTYAWNGVMYSMWETIIENRSIIHIPKEKRKLCFEYIELVDNVDKLSDDEICKKLSITKDTLKIIREILNIFKMCSINHEQDYVIYKLDENGQIYDFGIDVEKRVDLDAFYNYALADKKLTSIEKLILTERFYNGKLISDISKELGLDAKTVYNYKERALTKIRRNYTLIRKFKNYSEMISNRVL